LPSMMIATCRGPLPRSGASVAGAAAFDINQSFGHDIEHHVRQITPE
jgi:hypothetical protein